ncbi:acyltransferase family protein [Tunicatimonas pelagia]|uniref:acyltransferase family protein n=1 Tax=Tunicatimonas pelagia TaxID=931531 RepID=UPI002665579A|nr:acyltransferase [Tunicatimonas pelagia]WKN42315.1 acyltransferase [Tunicatimonas pelagia]
MTSTELRTSNRMVWVDIAKGFAIILVVYRHILIGIERSGIDVGDYIILADITHSFRMPLFFILSGVFVRFSLLKRTNQAFISSKLKSLIYPYLIWTTLQISVQWVFRDYINAHRTYLDYLYIFINPRAIDQFWFIYALFNVAVVYLLFFRLFKGNKLALLLLGCIFLFASQFIHTPVIEDVLMFFIYVAIGDIVSSFLLDERNYQLFASPKIMLLATALFAITQWLYFRHEVYDPFLLALIAITGCLFTFCIAFALRNSKYIIPIQIAGYHSMYIYLMHVLVSAPIRIVLVRFMQVDDPGVLVLISTIAATIIPVVFYKITYGNGWWFLFTPKRPKATTVSSPTLTKV